MDNKKSVFLVGIVIGVLVGAIVGLSIYTIADQMNDKDKSSEKNKKQTSETTKDDTKKEDVEPIEDKTLVTFDLSKFDGSLVINGDSSVAYTNDAYETSNEKLSIGSRNMYADLNDDKKSVDFEVKWDNYSNNGVKDDAKVYKYTIANFDRKIRKVYVGSWGQAIGKETIIYLMEDGTVEYTPITYKVVQEAIKSPDTYTLKSYGKINDVKDIVVIANGNGHNTQSAGSWHSLFAVKADGTFYDISKILEETDEYKN